VALFWYVCILRLAISTHVYYVAHFPFNSWLSLQRLCRFSWGYYYSTDCVLVSANGSSWGRLLQRTTFCQEQEPNLESAVFCNYKRSSHLEQSSVWSTRCHWRYSILSDRADRPLSEDAYSGAVHIFTLNFLIISRNRYKIQTFCNKKHQKIIR